MSIPIEPRIRQIGRSIASGLAGRIEGVDRFHAATALVALLSGVVVFAVASTVFAYHSSNHDEAVYLLQAAMLLEGQLELQAGELAGAFRPWFFVEDDGRLYPKYTPVPAALYAVSMALFGEPRVTLAVVAATNTVLVGALASTVADRRVGVVAAVGYAASPMAIVTTSVFLPYAPTTTLNLLFAVAYVRGIRKHSTVAAATAGGAIGLAFFARPYTAVLFAAPFICHALYRVASAVRTEGLVPLPGTIRRQGLTAAFGLLFVAVALLYNLRVTGSALLFPYEAFAPLDGPGFGRRRILGHAIDYTPAVALRSNGYVLWYFATRWFTAGPIGTGFAIAGVVVAARRWMDSPGTESGTVPTAAGGITRAGRTTGLLLAGLFVSVPLGNLFFWGNFNILATATDPADGLVSQYGPFYHFDLLVPLSVFAAIGVVACWDRRPAIRRRLAAAMGDRPGRILFAALVVGAIVLVGVAAVGVVATPLDRNADYADKHEQAYEPVETAAIDDAVVFLPTPYGDWQGHPFQYLRNDPGFDGAVVYANDRDPAGDFAVIDAYPDRTYYRYAYQGEWTPNPDRHVTPKLDPLEVRRGTTLAAETTVGVPDRVTRASVRLETASGDGTGANDSVEYAIESPKEAITVEWSLTEDGVELTDSTATGTLPLAETDAAVLTVTLVQPGGSTLTYRQEATVRTSDGGVEVIWPPERYVCPLVTDCGNDGRYVSGTHRDGVSFETSVEESG